MTADKGGSMTGIGKVSMERQRQIRDKGYTHAHDAEHEPHEMMAAAECYLRDARKQDRYGISDDEVPALWPWEREAWKPSNDPSRSLVKAGALIAAAIDRLDLAEAPDDH